MTMYDTASNTQQDTNVKLLAMGNISTRSIRRAKINVEQLVKFILVSFLLIMFTHISISGRNFESGESNTKQNYYFKNQLKVTPRWKDQYELFVEDQYFRPLLNSFKLRRSGFTNAVNKFRSGDIPTFLLIADLRYTFLNVHWHYQLLHITLNQCPVPCKFTVNKNESDSVDAIVFNIQDMKNKATMMAGLPKRDKTQPWIMLSLESALKANIIHGTDYREFNGVFNRTMMHRTDADIFTPHGFIVKNEDVRYLPKDWVLPPPNVTALQPEPSESKALVVAFISNCEAESGRLEYIKEMKRYIQVDIYGECGNLRCGTSMYSWHGYRIDSDECFKKAGLKYKFYLAFENAICKDYKTEKLYNLLYYPIVPVVFGGANYKDILPPNSYINAALYSPKDLVTYLQFLDTNVNKYNEYLEWRKFYRPSTIGGVLSMCDLCVKLYDPTFYSYNVYEDFYKWFYELANCNRRWLGNIGFVNL